MTFHPLMFQKLKPHIFTVGEQTYRNVKSLMEPVNQSIVVSGESGAGKVGGLLCCPLCFITGRTGREAGGHFLGSHWAAVGRHWAGSHYSSAVTPRHFAARAFISSLKGSPSSDIIGNTSQLLGVPAQC